MNVSPVHSEANADWFAIRHESRRVKGVKLEPCKKCHYIPI